MSTAVQSRTRPTEGEKRFLIHGLDWRGYETLLSVFEEIPIRIAYDRGSLELMSPSFIHERFGNLLGRMVETVTEELEIPCVMAGSTPFKREDLDRGVEPDKCYFLANAHRLRKVRNLDLAIDPPPDLAIEVEITTSVVNRLGIHGALGVLEVWRYDGERLKVLLRQPDGTYAESPASAAFPFLPMAELSSRWRNWPASSLRPTGPMTPDGAGPSGAGFARKCFRGFASKYIDRSRPTYPEHLQGVSHVPQAVFRRFRWKRSATRGAHRPGAQHDV